MTDRKPPAQPTLSATVSQKTYDIIEQAAAEGYRTKAQQVRSILDSWATHVERSNQMTRQHDSLPSLDDVVDEGVR